MGPQKLRRAPLFSLTDRGTQAQLTDSTPRGCGEWPEGLDLARTEVGARSTQTSISASHSLVPEPSTAPAAGLHQAYFPSSTLKPHFCPLSPSTQLQQMGPQVLQVPNSSSPWHLCRGWDPHVDHPSPSPPFLSSPYSTPCLPPWRSELRRTRSPPSRSSWPRWGNKYVYEKSEYSEVRATLERRRQQQWQLLTLPGSREAIVSQTEKSWKDIPSRGNSLCKCPRNERISPTMPQPGLFVEMWWQVRHFKPRKGPECQSKVSGYREALTTNPGPGQPATGFCTACELRMVLLF